MNPLSSSAMTLPHAPGSSARRVFRFFGPARGIAAALFLLAGIGLSLIPPCLAQSGSWSAVDDMEGPRTGHGATLLNAPGAWEFTGSLSRARQVHTATLLPDGNVLVAGGLGTGGGILNIAELYNPANGTWTTTA